MNYSTVITGNLVRKLQELLFAEKTNPPVWSEDAPVASDTMEFGGLVNFGFNRVLEEGKRPKLRLNFFINSSSTIVQHTEKRICSSGLSKMASAVASSAAIWRFLSAFPIFLFVLPLAGLSLNSLHDVINKEKE